MPPRTRRPAAARRPASSGTSRPRRPATPARDGVQPVTRDEYLRICAKDMREVPDFTTKVIRELRGAFYHVTHSRPAVDRSGAWSTPMQGHPGAPDIDAVHETFPLGLKWELKRWGQGKQSEPTAAQAEWLDFWARVPGIHAACFTTMDWVDGTLPELIADPHRLIRLAAEQTDKARAGHADVW